MLFLDGLHHQEPPLGEQFVAVGFADLGSTEEAGGDVETEAPSEVVQEAVEEEVLSNEPEPEQPVVQEEVVTQAASEVAVQSGPDPKPEPKSRSQSGKDRTAHLFRNPGAAGGRRRVPRETQGVGNEGDEAGKIEGRGLVSGDFGDAMLRGGTMIGEPKLMKSPDKREACESTLWWTPRVPSSKRCPITNRR